MQCGYGCEGSASLVTVTFSIICYVDADCASKAGYLTKTKILQTQNGRHIENRLLPIARRINYLNDIIIRLKRNFVR